jgi:adenylate kinase family enzyme
VPVLRDLDLRRAKPHGAVMRRVIILGCAGSGKSTLARRLGEQLVLPVIHLDNLFWEPHWVEADDAVFRKRVAAAIAGDAWITEGNYLRSTLPLRLPRADQIIVLTRPRWLLLWRVIVRALRFWGRERPDLAVGCPDKVDWPFLTYTWSFEKRVLPAMEAALAKYASHVPQVRLSSDAEVDAFMRRVRDGAKVVPPT